MNNIAVLIHVNDEIDTPQKQSLFNQLENTNGVTYQKFSENKKHLLFVEYDSNVTNSLELLNTVKAQGFESQLVGL